jgi:hypothetical protein
MPGARASRPLGIGTWEIFLANLCITFYNEFIPHIK